MPNPEQRGPSPEEMGLKPEEIKAKGTNPEQTREDEEYEAAVVRIQSESEDSFRKRFKEELQDIVKLGTADPYHLDQLSTKLREFTDKLDRENIERDVSGGGYKARLENRKKSGGTS